jgi:hypothetical protein
MFEKVIEVFAEGICDGFDARERTYEAKEHMLPRAQSPLSLVRSKQCPRSDFLDRGEKQNRGAGGSRRPRAAPAGIAIIDNTIAPIKCLQSMSVLQVFGEPTSSEARGRTRSAFPWFESYQAACVSL